MNFVIKALKTHRIFILILSIFFMAGFALAQTDPIGGPYSPDSATVLLLHFDGDFSDATGIAADGMPFGNISFLDNTELSGFGKMAYFKNDARSDSSYLIIPENDAHDLTGDWTIEGWVNFLTFGETTDDWNWRPMLLVKPWNYIMEMVGLTGLRFFSPSYRAADNTLVRIEGTWNLVDVGTWYHWTYIRDTQNHVIVLMIHDIDQNLIDFRIEPFDPAVPEPMQTNDPIQIGNWPFGLEGGFLNGLVDEVRISNVVRKFAAPPIIAKGWTDPVIHALPGEEIKIGTNIATYAGQITSAQLHYTTDGTNFNIVDMVNTGGDYYEATLPSQPLGTEVKYYISANNSLGFSSNTLQSAVSDTSYYGLGVWNDRSMVLHLDFEEGAGTPYDSSVYHNNIVVRGNPVYSTDAVSGNYSLYFEGDTSYLEISQPASFLTSKDITIDLWFKPEEIRANAAIVGKYPEFHWDDWQFGYRLWFRDDLGHLAPEVYIETPNAVDQRWTMVDLSTAVVAGNWYRIVMKVSEDNNIAVAQLYDSNNQLLEENSVTINGHIKPRAGAFRIGADYVWMPKFKGWLDNIKIYNYATNLPPAITVLYQPDILHVKENQAVQIRAEVKNATSVTLHYSTGGDFVEVPMTLESGQTYMGEIPGQPLSTKVEYYITATNESGIKAKMPSSGPNYGIGFWQPNSQVLALDFEEGSGVPVDNSIYHHQFQMLGNPQYSTDAAVGNYSLYLEGDSSYLEIPGPVPFLATDYITVDFWFKPEGTPAFATDLLGMFPARGDAWRFGYRVWFQDNGKIFPEIYLVNPNGADQMWTNMDFGFNISLNTWYHFRMEFAKDTAFAKIWDVNGILLAEKGAPIGKGQMLNPVGGKFTIGHSQFSDMPFFKGKIDDIKIYNYSLTYPTSINESEEYLKPTQFKLAQNYPNPFNPNTIIEFSIPIKQKVSLVIYDVLGREIKTLVNKNLSGGNYKFLWDGKNENGEKVTSGIYFYQLNSPKFVRTRKMILLR